MTPVRFGIVGYGFGGRYFHAALLAGAAGCELLGVVTTSAERRALVQQDLPGTATFSSLQELAAAGAEAVAISTPLATHVPLAREALELGLAVVCDKPFAPDAEQARELVALAERLGRPLSPYQNRRWDSDFRTVQRLMADGSLGTVSRVESRIERFIAAGPGVAGGGALLDVGSHLVDQVLLLLGPVTSGYAELHVRDDDGLDDDVFLALTHAGGARSQVWVSLRQRAPGPRFRVTGAAGTYVVHGEDGQADALIAGARPGRLGEPWTGENWGVEPASAWGRLHRGDAHSSDDLGEPVPTERGEWDSFYPAFAAAVRGEGPVPVDPRDAVDTAVVLDAAARSAATGQVVPLG